MKKVKILGVPFDVCTKDEALKRILDVLENRNKEPGKQIVTPNPEMLLESLKNKEFREVLSKAWLSIPDGSGILWASTFQEIGKKNVFFIRCIKGILSLFSLLISPRFCRKIFPERISGADFMESICIISRGKKIPIFLLGAKVGIAEKVKEILTIRYPEVNIVGTFSGSPNEDDFSGIQSIIAEIQPEILFVAYGAPKQEIWIAQHLPHLPSVKIAMGVGGTFDFLSGLSKRAPATIQQLGLEWLYRLIQEPSRLKRIFHAVVKFPWEVIKNSTKNRPYGVS